MEPDDIDEVLECVDCGQKLVPELDRTYSLNDDHCLCFACAVKRGGVFDEPKSRWLVPPDVRDEPDERRPHP